MEYIIYDRCNVAVLGDGEVESSKGMNSKETRCFNCGSPQHIVSKCSDPLNRPLIALSHAMYEFFKEPAKGEPERFHEYEERRIKRLQFTESFQAGSVRGELLLEALEMDRAENSGDKERGLPWLWRMLEWGYPPGWVSEEDPKLKILARIEGEGMWTDDLDATIIFDNLPQTSDTEHLSSFTNNCASAEIYKTLTTIEQMDRQRRWVHYPTTLFSSEHLAFYSGTPLPPLIHPDSSPVAGRKKQSCAVPPWRRPGAFSAFGPTGWHEYLDQEIIATSAPKPDSPAKRDRTSEDVEGSDMDLSE